MMLAAMAMTSCASSKKINDGSNAGKSSEMGKNEEDLDNSYLVLSDAQQDIVKKNNAFALRLFNKVTDMESKVISPMSVSYLMGNAGKWCGWNHAAGDIESYRLRRSFCQRSE